MRHLTVLIALSGLLTGCIGNMTIKMDYAPGNVVSAPVAQVAVTDLRAPGVAASRREAAFGTPMGNVMFDPPESQIVKNVLETELARIMKAKGLQQNMEFLCDILEFGVNTDTTPLYWDVIGRIRLTLKRDGKVYNLSGGNTERTFVWPGEAIIKRTVEESLKQIVTQLKQVEL